MPHIHSEATEPKDVWTQLKILINKNRNTHLDGPHGTGKTHHLIRAAEYSAENFVYLSCKKHNTAYQIYQQLIYKTSGSRPGIGYRISDLHERLIEQLNSFSGRFTVIFDDIAYLIHHDDGRILKQIPQLDQTHLVTATANPGFVNRHVTQATWNTYQPYLLETTAPDQEQIENVLTIHTNHMKTTSINHAIPVISQSSRNIRHAMIWIDHFLHHADNGRIDADTIRSLKPHVDADYRDFMVKSFSNHHRSILNAITSIPPETDTTGDVMKRYETICRRIDIRPLTQRRIASILTDLELAGIVSTSRTHGGESGNTKLISLVDVGRER